MSITTIATINFIRPVLRICIDWLSKQQTISNLLSKACISMFTFLTARYFAIRIYRKIFKYPPGYIGLPFFGVLSSLILKTEQFYCNCAKSDHKILTLPLGCKTIYLINDPQIMKNIWMKDNMIWRPANQFYSGKGADIAFLEGGSEWFKRRKIFQSNMVTMLNKNFLSKHVNEILTKFIFPIINKHCNDNTVWYPGKHENIPLVSFNIMYNCIFGNYLKNDNKDFLQFVKHVNQWQIDIIFNMFSWFLLGTTASNFIRNFIADPLKKTTHAMNDIVRKKFVANAIKSYNSNNVESYFDIIYQKLCDKKNDIDNIVDENTFDEGEIADLRLAVLGGVDTAGNMIFYQIILLAKYTQIQKEIYEEIVKNINDETGNLLDRISECPKLRAFVQESLRFLVVIPNVHRQVKNEKAMKIKVDNDTEYMIPKDGILCPNIIGMQRSEKYWKNPGLFDIYRWLNDKGKFSTKNNPMLFSFSAGQRSCPGEALAKKIMYLVIAQLLIKYKFYVDKPEKFNINFVMEGVMKVDGRIGCKIKKRL
eukprot:281285_1